MRRGKKVEDLKAKRSLDISFQDDLLTTLPHETNIAGVGSACDVDENLSLRVFVERNELVDEVAHARVEVVRFAFEVGEVRLVGDIRGADFGCEEVLLVQK